MDRGHTALGSDSSCQSSGWHSRHYLPHLDQPGLVQAITFRLADALPAARVAELDQGPADSDGAKRRQRLEAMIDAGYGACYLRDPRVGRLVEAAFLHFDGVRYRLLAWVVMPNHVHLLIEPLAGYALSDIVQSWKSFTAKEANRLLRRTGRFWQPEYFDRSIRDERHFAAALKYIEENPVKAGLVSEPSRWPFSSATGRSRDK